MIKNFANKDLNRKLFDSKKQRGSSSKKAFSHARYMKGVSSSNIGSSRKTNSNKDHILSKKRTSSSTFRVYDRSGKGFSPVASMALTGRKKNIGGIRSRKKQISMEK